MSWCAVESQACAVAAKERIEVLEQEAETAMTEHQQALDKAAEEIKQAQDDAEKQLQKAGEAAAEHVQQLIEQHSVALGKVNAELAAVKVSRKSCLTRQCWAMITSCLLPGALLQASMRTHCMQIELLSALCFCYFKALSPLQLTA